MGVNTYSTQQIAQHSGVCVNTIRNYEKSCYISKSQRAVNGYRMFTDIHKLQMTICRLIFTPPYINKMIRKTSMEVIYASGKEDFSLCKKQTERYIAVIENELTKANEAVTALESFNRPKNINVFFDRKEAADIIGTTVETIRNWERNRLIISVERNKKKVYNQNEIDVMHLIYVLLSSGFYIQKIYDSLMFLREADNKKAVTALCDSYDYMYIDNINKNIIDKTNEVLISAHEIMKLLEKNF